MSASAIKKPMLAGKCDCPEALSFPVLATPKLDGIRCLKIAGQALTRSFKPISNTFARQWIEANLPDGLDGELMLRGGTFNATTSATGRESGEPDFVFHVFDYVSEGIDVPYACRVKELQRLPQWEYYPRFFFSNALTSAWSPNPRGMFRAISQFCSVRSEMPRCLAAASCVNLRLSR